jgi:hypothetical protein
VDFSAHSCLFSRQVTPSSTYRDTRKSKIAADDV